MKAHQIASTPLKSKPELKSKGALNKILKTKRGSTYYLATNIYWDTLRSWHNPRKIHKANGNVIYINKLRTEVIYTSIGELSEEHACCKESIRKALVYLELQGLISRSYQHNEQKKSYNKLKIYVWKDTPHFYSEFGVDNQAIVNLNPHTNHEYIGKKYAVNFKQKNGLRHRVSVGYPTQSERGTKELRREGIGDIPPRYISPIPLEKKECVRAGNIETTPDAALPNLRGSSTGEFLIQPDESQEFKPINPVKTAKPRIVITAAMQHGTTPLPLPLQASGLASSEVSTISSEPVPVLVPLLTLEQERERERAHQTRRQKTTHDIAKPLGATVLSLLPRSVLEANFVTKTHQKGVEFQLAVENSLSNDTLEPLIESGIAEKLEPKTINENSSAIFHHANSRETEDTKMAALPYREEESDWAKDFKTQMTSDCQFEHPIDFWEYKAALKAMELAQDEGSKVMTLTGSYFDLKDLKKKHLKAFAAKFYEVLPDHEFKFEESAI